jgi:HEAT repeat protein
MDPRKRLIGLVVVFVVVSSMLAIRIVSSDDGAETNDNVIKRDAKGRLKEQTGDVSVESARRSLESTDPGIREIAIGSYARALVSERRGNAAGERLPSAKEVAPLVKIAADERVAGLRATAITALGTVRAYEEMDVLTAAIDDKSPLVRDRAIRAFGAIYGVVPACKATDRPAVRRAALKRLADQADSLMKTAKAYYNSKHYKVGAESGPKPRGLD